MAIIPRHGVAQTVSAQSESRFEQLLEAMVEAGTDDVEVASILEDLTALAEEPLNINSASVAEFDQLHLLSYTQVQSIISYRENYGAIVSSYELIALPQFSKALVDAIAPFICFEEIGSLGDKRHRLLGDWLVKLQSSFPKAKGYQAKPDGTPSAFAGNEWKYYTRLRVESGRFSVGTTAEKDPGEAFFKSPNGAGFDYYSAFANYEGKGVVKQVVVGDYHLRFGQGVAIWSGMGLGKSIDVLGTGKSGQGIRPYSSTDENRFFRGLAGTIGNGSLSLSVFYSSKKRDANVEKIGDCTQVVTSIQTSGYHRTAGEIVDKNVLGESVYGMYGEFRKSHFRIGTLLLKQRFDLPLQPAEVLYKKNYFEGRENCNLGIDYQLSLSGIQLFGELARSKNGEVAGVQGVSWLAHPQFQLSALYRYFAPGFHSFYGDAFSETSGNRNESGFYAGIIILPLPQLKFSVYADAYRFPWLHSSTSSPGNGTDLFAQLDYAPSKKMSAYFRAKWESKPMKVVDNSGIYHDEETISATMRLHFIFNLNERWLFKSRIEHCYFEQQPINETGLLLFQDVQYLTVNHKVKIGIRGCWFDTDSYQSRIYAYENDVLYHFAIPAFYGNGLRGYLNLKLQLLPKFSFYSKIGRTLHRGASSWGSGNDLTSGDHRTEVRFLLKVKL